MLNNKTRTIALVLAAGYLSTHMLVSSASDSPAAKTTASLIQAYKNVRAGKSHEQDICGAVPLSKGAIAGKLRYIWKGVIPKTKITIKSYGQYIEIRFMYKGELTRVSLTASKEHC